MRSGCPWRLLPSNLPPWSTVYRWFAKFRDEGCFEKINHALSCSIANGPDANASHRSGFMIFETDP
jgi:transposase